MSVSGSDNPDKLYNDLAAKWLNGTISPEEEKQFHEWYNRSQEDPVIIPAEFAESRQELRNRIFKNIKGGMKGERRVKPIYALFTRVAAAILIIAGGLGTYYYLKPISPKEIAHKISPAQQMPLKPLADTMAVLTLSDGSDILLDNAADGQLAQQGNAQVIKANSRQLVYRPGGDAAVSDVQYNSIRTPKGGQYQVVLPDNSVVWLNASSSLRFPTVFSGKERAVELTGEGYFEVAKNKRLPFKITVNGMEVRVLGTHFNIMAYNEEAEVNTTLLEGAVKVNRGAASLLLKPGQQAVLVKDDNQLNLNRSVNVDQVMAWKQGEFRFENTRVEAIMRQVARWYDINVTYDEGLSGIGLTGSISRSNSVSQLLEILEATHRVKFVQDGNRIRVKVAGK